MPDAYHQLSLKPEDQLRLNACPICGGTAARPFHKQPYGEHATIHHHRCSACGLIYMNPVPTQEWYNRLYGDEFWEVKSAQTQQGEIWRNERQWFKGLARADKFIDLLRREAPQHKAASVLEIGASFGLIGTSIAAAYNGRAYGVEPNRGVREFASRVSGMQLAAETVDGLESWEPAAPVDLVILSHVLENIVDVDGALTKIRAKMRTGGLLLIETPNVEWQPSMSIYHPHCFSAVALGQLLGRNGFRVRLEHRSGRPASAIFPRYLTVIAEAIDGRVAAQTRTAPPIGFRRTKFQHFLYRAFYSTALAHLDGQYCQRKYCGTPFVVDGCQRLKERLSELSAAR